MKKIERFIKTAGIYFLGNALTKMLSFFLLPLYTNKINPSDFGEYGLVITMVNLLIPIFFFQIWDGVFRFSFDYTDKKDKYIIFSNGFIIMSFGVAILIIGYLLITNMFDIKYSFLVFVYSLSIGIQFYYNYVARSMQRNVLFVVSGIINSIVMLVINIVLIIGFNRGIDALYISSIIGNLIQVAIIESKIKLFYNFKISYIKKSIIKKLGNFSLPLSISTVINWFLTGYTQLLISIQLGSYANGLFTVSSKFTAILVLFVGVFQFAWNEMAYAMSIEEDNISKYSKGATEILKITIIITGLFILVIKIVFPYVIGEQYHDALYLIPILMVGTMANTYSGCLKTIFLANKKSNKLFATTLMSSIVNIVLSQVLISKWALIGAVVALSLSFIVGVLTRIVLLYVTEGVAPDKKAYLTLIILFSTILVYYFVDNNIYLVFIILLYIIVSLFILKKSLLLVITMFKNRKSEK